jgi:hypothetical protein
MFRNALPVPFGFMRRTASTLDRRRPTIEPGQDFLRYVYESVYESVDAGQPDDLFNPVQSPSETR